MFEEGVSPGRGEWPSGQKRQTVNLLKVFYVGSNPASPTCCRLKRRESRRKPRRANRAKLFFLPCREVQFSRMRFREVVEKRRSIEIPHLYPIENRSESLPASACSLCSRHTHAPAIMPPWFGTKPSETYDRRRKRPPSRRAKTCSFEVANPSFEAGVL